MSDILDEVWGRVVGGLDWLKQVILGEFQDNRDLSAVVADMLVSFIPGVVIVTSARDLTAVILRLAQHEERREKTEEWMLLVACAVPLVLPVLAAAAGAAAAGVGAIIGGIAGSEAAAALRAVCLLLIKKGQALVEVVGFLRRFIKGDILKVLRDIKFRQYGQALTKYVSEFIGKLIGVIQRVRAELLKVNAFKMLDDVLAKLADLERRFYGVQQAAMANIPKALAELDIRLQQVLAETLPHSPRPATAGIPAPMARPIVAEPQRVPSMSQNPLGTPSGTSPPKGPPPRVKPEANLHPEHPRQPKTGGGGSEPPKQPPGKGSKMEPAKPKCFKPGDDLKKNWKGDPKKLEKEYFEQLKAQEEGLNKLTVQEYLENRQRYEQVQRAGTGKAQEAARQKMFDEIKESVEESNRARGLSGRAAEAAAIEKATEVMASLAALHDPDMIAGGHDPGRSGASGATHMRMGDRGVNSSIGSQWPKGGRLEVMDEAARKALADHGPNTPMHVKLERCR
ncbi:polymorphic toxin type 15 domain-containing protein [Inhella proteolytica]|uniref:Novel toxin 15 domain-containing protein n=1 Tax=Inhella proteolytica TaxID=2795029 RepID=A0A931NFJ7_9BURK|nr:polymorphic toxin type 15 domain-containing protein [Inhella proteolytica]MBH9578867.1 hypothetical protein [Inhella proteolytica]